MVGLPDLLLNFLSLSQSLIILRALAPVVIEFDATKDVPRSILKASRGEVRSFMVCFPLGL